MCVHIASRSLDITGPSTSMDIHSELEMYVYYIHVQ